MNQLLHEHFIRHTLTLARQGQGQVSPNPMVGAIIVSPQGEIIAEGFHRQYGGPHAEVEAITAAHNQMAQQPSQDLSLIEATLYCSLEPCCHTNKKTPPCTELIIKNKIKKVVVATLDPNPQVCGQGVQRLRAAGIAVEVGFLEKEASELNERFFHFMRTGLPFVQLKWAQTLDGFIATKSGHSKWISGDLSRQRAHFLRGLNDGILVGMNTLVQDNPQLNIRVPHLVSQMHSPRRIVIGNMAHLPVDAHVLSDENAQQSILCSTQPMTIETAKKMQNLPCTVIDISSACSHQETLAKLVSKLAENKISSVLVEGGAQVLNNFIKAKLAQKASIFIAPKILGNGLNATGELNILKMQEAIKLERTTLEKIDEDIFFEGYFSH